MMGGPLSDPSELEHQLRYLKGTPLQFDAALSDFELSPVALEQVGFPGSPPVRRGHQPV